MSAKNLGQVTNNNKRNVKHCATTQLINHNIIRSEWDLLECLCRICKYAFKCAYICKNTAETGQASGRSFL